MGKGALEGGLENGRSTDQRATQSAISSFSFITRPLYLTGPVLRAAARALVPRGAPVRAQVHGPGARPHGDDLAVGAAEWVGGS